MLLQFCGFANFIGDRQRHTGTLDLMSEHAQPAIDLIDPQRDSCFRTKAADAGQITVTGDSILDIGVVPGPGPR